MSTRSGYELTEVSISHIDIVEFPTFSFDSNEMNSNVPNNWTILKSIPVQSEQKSIVPQ